MDRLLFAMVLALFLGTASAWAEDKTPVKFNIPEAEAVGRLQDLIREHGKWVDPAPVVS